ncbi:hypothetical protein [Bhargavaea beijingensis]|uniref:Uncharacterized protein n=1 Tax=Bhargavaea beijingensis TaxID=426756 RepID=A0ABX9ZDX0_9BACL|nr:hypothetical protein [Bhargavaea beijingensis]MCW1928050.1 hypothetical protein [Bhargavaea beijingensis]RSK34277.1 hypothetical protein EJA12_04925 [Bhargavaea beijingensis]
MAKLERSGLTMTKGDRLAERVLRATPIADWTEKLKHSFEDAGRRLTNPDVYRISTGTKMEIRRTWQEE